MTTPVLMSFVTVVESIMSKEAEESVFNSATKSCAFTGTNKMVWSTLESKSKVVVDTVSKHAAY